MGVCSSRPCAGKFLHTQDWHSANRRSLDLMKTDLFIFVFFQPFGRDGCRDPNTRTCGKFCLNFSFANFETFQQMNFSFAMLFDGLLFPALCFPATNLRTFFSPNTPGSWVSDAVTGRTSAVVLFELPTRCPEA